MRILLAAALGAALLAGCGGSVGDNKTVSKPAEATTKDARIAAALLAANRADSRARTVVRMAIVAAENYYVGSGAYVGFDGEDGLVAGEPELSIHRPVGSFASYTSRADRPGSRLADPEEIYVANRGPGRIARDSMTMCVNSRGRYAYCVFFDRRGKGIGYGKSTRSVAAAFKATPETLPPIDE